MANKKPIHFPSMTDKEYKEYAKNAREHTVTFGNKKKSMAKKMGSKLDRFNKKNKGAGKQTNYLNK